VEGAARGWPYGIARRAARLLCVGSRAATSLIDTRPARP
jgi:hypothetical protein